MPVSSSTDTGSLTDSDNLKFRRAASDLGLQFDVRDLAKELLIPAEGPPRNVPARGIGAANRGWTGLVLASP